MLNYDNENNTENLRKPKNRFFFFIFRADTGFHFEQ